MCMSSDCTGARNAEGNCVTGQSERKGEAFLLPMSEPVNVCVYILTCVCVCVCVGMCVYVCVCVCACVFGGLGTQTADAALPQAKYSQWLNE